MKKRKWNAVDGSIELETDDLGDDLDDHLEDVVDDHLEDVVDELVQRIDRRAV